MTDDPEVLAAGAAVFRRSGGAVEWAVIHRPRYDDWSLPKGKLDPGEDFATAAAREVREEIGVAGRLGAELPPTRYRDHKGRSKVVRYWLMEAPPDDAFVANEEVDELRWLPGDAAVHALTYDRDRELLAAAMGAVAQTERPAGAAGAGGTA